MRQGHPNGIVKDQKRYSAIREYCSFTDLSRGEWQQFGQLAGNCGLRGSMECACLHRTHVVSVSMFNSVPKSGWIPDAEFAVSHNSQLWMPFIMTASTYEK
jgi:hypothetical protein